MALVNDLLAEIDSRDPVQKLLLVSQDVLGVYRIIGLFPPMRTEVHLFWAVIALVSGWLGTSVEGLTVVVLAHELAHGYTHIGADIDRVTWDTDAFINAEKGLIEGLAQHYTHLVCQALEFRFPEALAAYQALLPRQPPPYQTQKQWEKVHSKEMIRLALLTTRRRMQTTLAEFMKNLNQAEQDLT